MVTRKTTPSRRRRKRNIFLGSFYFNPSVQYATTIISAIVFAGFVFSGFLLFRFTDADDLMSRGKRLMSEGKVAWAAKTFQTLVNKHPGNYEAHVRLGEAFLELGDRRLAEREFQIASSLKSRGSISSEASVAMSKLAIARQEYGQAEQHLLEALKKDKKDRTIRTALFELYENWGDTLMAEPIKDYPGIIRRYERAVRYAGEYELEEAVKGKLITAVQEYSEELALKKEYAKSIAVLKKSLRYRYQPETMIEIAKMYEYTDKLDNAIQWYRKAYDANPSLISIRLANILVKKGRLLLDEKKPEEAEKYFTEADKISKNSNVPLDSLYPVKVANIGISTDIDEATGEFDPTVTVKMVNEAGRPLSFLAVKAVFMSGDEQLAIVTENVASPDEPLGSKDSKKSSREIKIKPTDKLNVHMLSKGKLMVRIFIAYNEGDEQTWKLKAVQEAIIRTGPPPEPSEPV